MTTNRRQESSRENGKKSQGPKTSEGKARSSQNARRHGLLSRQVVLDNESPEQFRLLFRQYAEQFRPESAAEFGFLEEMVAAYWRMRRAWAIEKQSLDAAISNDPGETPLSGLATAWRHVSHSNDIALLHRYETMMHHRFHRAFQNYMQLKTLRQNPPPAPKPDTEA